VDVQAKQEQTKKTERISVPCFPLFSSSFPAHGQIPAPRQPVNTTDSVNTPLSLAFWNSCSRLLTVLIFIIGSGWSISAREEEFTGSFPSWRDLRRDYGAVGDGRAGETGTRLNWAGQNDGVVIRVAGPSHATLRDFYIHAGEARALLVEDCDQPRGRILADQLNANGPTAKGNASVLDHVVRFDAEEQSRRALTARQTAVLPEERLRVTAAPVNAQATCVAAQAGG